MDAGRSLIRGAFFYPGPVNPWVDYNDGREVTEQPNKKSRSEKAEAFYRKHKGPSGDFFLGNHQARPLERVVPIDKVHVIPMSFVAGGANGADFFVHELSRTKRLKKPGPVRKFFARSFGTAIGAPLGAAFGTADGTIRWLRTEIVEGIKGKATYVYRSEDF